MANIFVVSDTHFNHANILKFSDQYGKPIRPFHNVNEMNEVMIENWNRVVTPQDKVYHLGDVYFGPQQEADTILSRLNGKKRLLLGNHDNGKDTVLLKHFQKIELWRKFSEEKLLLTHVPVHESVLGESRFKGVDGVRNVHGHIHQNQSPSNRHVNVSVEQTNYTPVSIEEL